MPTTITQLNNLHAETLNAVKKARFLIMAWPYREVNTPPISHWHEEAYKCFDKARTLLGGKNGERIAGLIAHCEALEIVQRILTTFTPICGGPYVDPLTPDSWKALCDQLVTEHSKLQDRLIVATKPANHPNKPSKNKQADILTAIKLANMPLQRPQLVEDMKLRTEGRLGHELAWMVNHNVLINIPNQGYWPADLPLPE